MYLQLGTWNVFPPGVTATKPTGVFTAGWLCSERNTEVSRDGLRPIAYPAASAANIAITAIHARSVIKSSLKGSYLSRYSGSFFHPDNIEKKLFHPCSSTMTR